MRLKKVHRPLNPEGAQSKAEVLLRPRPPIFQNAEASFWNKFKFVAGHKHDGSIVEAVDFSPSEPHDYLSVASTKITIFDSATNTEKKSISKMEAPVHSAAFRLDGRLIAAGGDSKVVQVYDAVSRNSLRSFKGHSDSIRVVKWSAQNTELLSADRGGSVRVWDLPSETEKLRLHAHTDQVSSLALNPSNPDLWLSASYDHQVKLWDLRAGQSVRDWRLDESEQIESILCFPSGSAFVLAAGNGLQVWDLLAVGHAPLVSVSNHQKTVTCLAFDGTHRRLLSGSLDQHVKIYDVRDYSVVHSFRYGSPVVAVAVSPNNSHVLVGCTDGVLSVRQRSAGAVDEESERASVEKDELASLHLGGGNERRERKKRARSASSVVVRASDHLVVSERKVHLRKFEIFLRKFDYRRALDAALKSNDPAVVVACFNQLIDHEAVGLAVSGRDDTQLQSLLRFCLRHITDPFYAALLIGVVHVFVDLYGAVIGQSESVRELLNRIRVKLERELRVQPTLMELQGAVEMLIAGATSEGPLPIIDEEPMLTDDQAHTS